MFFLRISIPQWCQRVKIAVATTKSSNRNWKREIINNPTIGVCFGICLLLVFVLIITNQKPVYKHTISSYENKNIHDEETSKFDYGVVIDCGSSGSRVFIYYWPPHTGNKNELLKIKQMIDLDGNPVRLKIKPGECLSFFLCVHSYRFFFLLLIMLDTFLHFSQLKVRALI